MVPPRGRIPETSLSVSSNDFSGQIRPSKPSGMPMTFHLYFRMAALVAARMTALRPGASPPPVAIPMQRMSGIEKFVVGRSSLAGLRKLSRLYDNTVTFGDGNLRVGVDSISDELRGG